MPTALPPRLEATAQETRRERAKRVLVSIRDGAPIASDASSLALIGWLLAAPDEPRYWPAFQALVAVQVTAFSTAAALALFGPPAPTARSRWDACRTRAWQLLLASTCVGLVASRVMVASGFVFESDRAMYAAVARVSQFDAGAMAVASLACVAVYLRLVREAGPVSLRSGVIRAIGVVMSLGALRALLGERIFATRFAYWADAGSLSALVWLFPLPSDGRRPIRLAIVAAAAAALLSLAGLGIALRAGAADRGFHGCVAPSPGALLFEVDLGVLARLARWGDVAYSAATALAIVSLAAYMLRARSSFRGVLRAPSTTLLLAVLASSLLVRVIPPDRIPCVGNQIGNRGDRAVFSRWDALPFVGELDRRGELKDDAPLFFVDDDDEARTRAIVAAARLARQPLEFPLTLDIVARPDVRVVDWLTRIRRHAFGREVTAALWANARYRISLPGFDPWPPRGTVHVRFEALLLGKIDPGGALVASHACRDRMARYDPRGSRIVLLGTTEWWLEPNVRYDSLVRALAKHTTTHAGARITLALPEDRASLERWCGGVTERR